MSHVRELRDLDRPSQAAAGAGFIPRRLHQHGPAIAADEAAIQAMGAALAGSNRPLTVTAGTVGLPTGRPATEDDLPSEHLPRKSASAAGAVDSGCPETGVRGSRRLGQKA